MCRRFIEALECRYTGLEYDKDYYFNSIFSIMKNVYKERYPFIYTTSAKPIDDEFAKTEKVNFSFENGTLIIEYETFISWCMEKLIDHKLEQKAFFKSFDNDNQLAGYFYRAFENLLTEEIAKLTPGLTSRIKQINQVLKGHCKNHKINGKNVFN